MDIAATILKFRNMADFLAEHRTFLESLPTEDYDAWKWRDGHYVDESGREASYVGVYISTYYRLDLTFSGPDSKDLMTQVRRYFGGKWDKQGYGETFTLSRRFGAVLVELDTERELVCTPRTTGTRIVQKRDPDVEIPMIDVEEPIVEWDCDPVLAGDE